MRQGNDMGYDTARVYTYSAAQAEAAQASRDEYNERLSAAGYNAITTEIIDAPEFYYAEEYHQQYLDKNPRILRYWRNRRCLRYWNGRQRLSEFACEHRAHGGINTEMREPRLTVAPACLARSTS